MKHKMEVGCRDGRSKVGGRRHWLPYAMLTQHPAVGKPRLAICTWTAAREIGRTLSGRRGVLLEARNADLPRLVLALNSAIQVFGVKSSFLGR
jgi:hypothetical protein